MKRMICGLAGLALMICLLLGTAAFPAGAESLPTPYIQDDAELLTAEEEEKLYLDMQPLCEYGTPMLWTTTDASMNFETMARQFYYRTLGQRQSGTLLVINMGVRQLTIFSDGEIYRDGDYYGCARSAFSQIYSLLQGERIARPMKITSNALLALVLSMLGVYLYISHRYETRPRAGKVKGAALPVTAAGAAVFAASTMNRHAKMTKQKKIDISSSSGGGGGHGGGGGGGGGGGFSGGGGSHGF